MNDIIRVCFNFSQTQAMSQFCIVEFAFEECWHSPLSANIRDNSKLPIVVHSFLSASIHLITKSKQRGRFRLKIAQLFTVELFDPTGLPNASLHRLSHGKISSQEGKNQNLGSVPSPIVSLLDSKIA